MIADSPKEVTKDDCGSLAKRDCRRSPIPYTLYSARALAHLPLSHARRISNNGRAKELLVIETHDIGRRLDGYTSTQAAVRRQKAANSKHHATERKKKRKYPLILWVGNISRAISLLTHNTHDDTTHASFQKGTRQTHIKIDAAPTPPQSPSHTLLNPYRQMRVFVAQADLYTLSYSIPLKDIDNFLHTSTLFPLSLKGGETYRLPAPLLPGSGGGTSGFPYASVPSCALQSGQYHFARREGMSSSVMFIQGR